MITEVLSGTVLAAASYWAGRSRLGWRLFDWAESRSANPHGLLYGAALAVGFAALAGVFLIHPRRSVGNFRAWRKEKP